MLIADFAHRLAEAFRTGMTPKGYMAFREAAEKIDVRHLLDRISVPTLVVHDKTFRVERVAVVVRRLAPLIPDARFVETDDLSKVIDEFLREGGLIPATTGKAVAATDLQDLSSGTAVILFAEMANLLRALGES